MDTPSAKSTTSRQALRSPTSSPSTLPELTPACTSWNAWA